MKNLAIVLGLTVVLAGCARSEAIPPVGTDVTVEKRDGIHVAGKLVEVKPEHVVVEGRDGIKTEVPKSQIASVQPAPALVARSDAETKAAAGAEAKTPAEEKAPAAPAAPEPPHAPKPDDTSAPPAKTIEYREVTIPVGTTLSATLGTPVASDTSKVEDPVRATLKTSVSADGLQALPAGTTLLGHVTGAERSGKVEGRASIAFRFSTVDLPGNEGRQPISSATISHVAPATKKKDATKIGIGAGAGAVIGGIVGGGSGAAKGAAIGGGAGTAAVLATRGDEVRLEAGAPLSIKLTAPLTVRIRLK